MICAKSYQDIPDDPRDSERFMSSEDCFEEFLSIWCKEQKVDKVSDEDYELIRKWWFKFCDGMDYDFDYGSDRTLQEMKEELSEE